MAKKTIKTDNKKVPFDKKGTLNYSSIIIM